MLKVRLITTRDGGETMLCSGSIVDSLHILTAASCLQRNGYAASTDQVKVLTTPAVDQVSRELKLESIEIHPSYAEDQISYDLAVLKLAPGEVDVDQIACLPRRPLGDYVVDTLQMSGFGARGKKAPSVLEFKSGGAEVKDIRIGIDCMPDAPANR
jgi:Trypsin